MEIGSTVSVLSVDTKPDSFCESTPPSTHKPEMKIKPEDLLPPRLPTLDELCMLDLESRLYGYMYPTNLPFKLIQDIIMELDNDIVLDCEEDLTDTSETVYSKPSSKDEESSESAKSVYSEEEKADSPWEMMSENDAEKISFKIGNQESPNEDIDDSLDEGQANDPTAALLSGFKKSSMNEWLAPENSFFAGLFRYVKRRFLRIWNLKNVLLNTLRSNVSKVY